MPKVGIIYNCYGVLKFKILKQSEVFIYSEHLETRPKNPIQATRVNRFTSKCSIYDKSTESVCKGRIIENKFLIKLISLVLKDLS